MRFGRAMSLNIGTEPTVVVPEGVIAIDSTEKIIVLGDGKTVGGIDIPGKVWEFGTIEEANTARLTVGDYVLVDNDKFWAVGDIEIVEVELITEVEYEEEASASLPAKDWENLSLFNGWDMSDDSVGNAKVRKDGNFVTIDAVMEKKNWADWSPFRLPEWARPSKVVYTTVELNQGRGTDPLVIYPDGYLYPRKSYSRTLSRFSIQITFYLY